MSAAVKPAPVTPEELAGLIGAFNDVTQKLQASHESLRAQVERLTQELDEANTQVERSRRLAALGEVAAGIAHEVRNPLGSIRLYARMLEQDLADQPDQKQLAAKIGRAVQTVDAIVGDVLTFAREFRVRHERVEVPALFDRVLESCCHDGVPGWKRTQIVRSDRRTGALAQVEGDPGLLQQALVNVVRNAFEAMSDAGEGASLTLDAREERVAGSDGCQQPHAVLSVRDTGPGLSEDVAARMFNPFFTTRNTGTGLGLAIVHRIVDAHAGRVRVRGDLRPGTAVEIVIPRLGMSREATTDREQVGRRPGACVETHS